MMNNLSVWDKVAISIARSNINDVIVFEGSYALKQWTNNAKMITKYFDSVKIKDVDIDIHKIITNLSDAEKTNYYKQWTLENLIPIFENGEFFIISKDYEYSLEFGDILSRTNNKNAYGFSLTIHAESIIDNKKIYTPLQFDVTFDPKGFITNKVPISYNSNVYYINVYEIEKYAANKILAMLKRVRYLKNKNNQNWKPNYDKFIKDKNYYDFIKNIVGIDESKLKYYIENMADNYNYKEIMQKFQKIYNKSW